MAIDLLGYLASNHGKCATHKSVDASPLFWCSGVAAVTRPLYVTLLSLAEDARLLKVRSGTSHATSYNYSRPLLPSISTAGSRSVSDPKHPWLLTSELQSLVSHSVCFVLSEV